MKSFTEFLEKVRHDRAVRNKAVVITAVLSVVVALGVFWVLRSEGLAKTHRHTEDCRGQVTVCGLDGAGHLHTAQCYVPVTYCGRTEHLHGDKCYSLRLTCFKTENEYHKHDESCYDSTLICSVEEHVHDGFCFGKPFVCAVEEHTHSDQCQLAVAQTEPAAECTLQEHTHGDDCVQSVLICEEGEHTHGESCYDGDELICTEAEHTHSDDCYDVVDTCGLAEHTHGDSCQTAGPAAEDGEAAQSGCQLAEHEHTDECFGHIRSCGLDEHEHTDACFQVTLTCTLPEDGNHTHNRNCREYTPVCGHEAHRHTSLCYIPEPFCGKEEHVHQNDCYAPTTQCGLDHAHSTDCFLICTEEAHEHGSACFPGEMPQCGQSEWVHEHTDDCYVLGYTCGYGDPVTGEQEPDEDEKDKAPSSQESLPLDMDTEATLNTEPAADLLGDDVIGDYETGEMVDDVAYINTLRMGASGGGDNGIIDGTAPWDTSVRDGNDTGDKNLIVRTFDRIDYTFYHGAIVREEGYVDQMKSARVGFEFLLAGDDSQVYFDTDAMGWLRIPAYDVKYKTEQVTINNVKYRCLRGSFKWVTDGGVVTAAEQSKTVSLRVMAMANGETIQPIFTMWFEANDVDDGMTDGIPTKTVYGSNYSCQTHNEQEYITVKPQPVTVTCTPRYNINIAEGEYSSTSRPGVWNFGSNPSLIDASAGTKYGRIYAYGLAVMIQGKSAEHGLRGCAVPKATDSLEFDIELRSWANGTNMGYKDVTSDKLFPTLVWDYGEFFWNYKRQTPANEPNYGAPYNWDTSNFGWTSSGNYCYNGGNWTFNQITTNPNGSSATNGMVSSFSRYQEQGLEGTYYIASAVNNDWVMGVTGTANGAKMELQQKTDSPLQKFDLVKCDDGSYGIRHVSSGLWMDLPNATEENGNRLQLWTVSNSIARPNGAQRWTITADGSNYKFSLAKNTGYALDLNQASCTQGQAIQLYTDNGSVAQRWTLIPAETVNDPQGLDGKTFYIRPYLNYIPQSSDGRGNPDGGDYALTAALSAAENGTNVRVGKIDRNDLANYQFYFEAARDYPGYYYIQSVATGAEVNIAGGGTGNGNNIHLWNTFNTDSVWKVEPRQAENGHMTYYLTGYKGQRMNLDGWLGDGRNVHVWEGTGDLNWWCLEEVPESDVQNNRRVVHVTLQGYDFRMDKLPYRRQNDQPTSNVYYNPSDIGTQYWRIQNAVFSSGELWLVSPFYQGQQTKDDPSASNYMCSYFNDNTITYNNTIVLSNLKVNSHPVQMTTLPKKQTTTVTLKSPGSFEQTAKFIKPLGTWAEPLVAGCASSLGDYLTSGDYLSIAGEASYDNATNDDRGIALNTVIKFDDAFFEPVTLDEIRNSGKPYGGWSPLSRPLDNYSNFTSSWPDYDLMDATERAAAKASGLITDNTNHFGDWTNLSEEYIRNGNPTHTVVYGAKKDKTGWNHNGKLPSENQYETIPGTDQSRMVPGSYDYEMLSTSPDDLVWFDRLEDLQAQGYVCVAAAIEYRYITGDAYSGNALSMNHYHFQIHGKAKLDATTSQSYMTSVETRAWSMADMRETVQKKYGLEKPGDVTFWHFLDYTRRYFPTYSPIKLENGIRQRMDENSADYVRPTRERSWRRYSPSADNTPPASGVDEKGWNGYSGFGSAEKPTYQNGSMSGGSGAQYFIDSVYLLGYKSQVTVRTAQTTKDNVPVTGDHTDQTGDIKQTYSYNLNETAVDYRVNASAVRSGDVIGTGSTTTILSNVNVRVTIPAGLTYVPGSAFYGGNYVQEPSFQINGTVTGGKYFEQTAPASGKYTLQITNNADGTTTLDFVVPDVQFNQPLVALDGIYYSCTVDELANTGGTGREFVTVAEVWTDRYDKDMIRSAEAGNLARFPILILKEESQNINNLPQQRIVDVTQPVRFDLSVFNDTNVAVKGAKIMDFVPLAGKGVNSNLHGNMRVKSFQIVSTENVDLSNVQVYYTSHENYQWGGVRFTDLSVTSIGDPSVFFNLDTIGTVTRNTNGTIYSWTRNASDTSNIWAIGFNADLAAQGKIKMVIEYEPDANVRPGDILYNRLSLYNGQNTRYKDANSQYVTRSIEGYVWMDANADGLQTAGEEPVDGVTVALFKWNDSANAYLPVPYASLTEEAYFIQPERSAFADDSKPTTEQLTWQFNHDGSVKLVLANGSSLTKFKTLDSENGLKLVYNFGTGKYLAIPDGNPQQGTNLLQTPFAGHRFSQWQLLDGTAVANSKVFKVGNRPVGATDVCVHVENAYYAVGKLLHLWNTGNVAQTNFRLVSTTAQRNMVIETGQTTSRLAGSEAERITANTNGAGYYRFSDLEAGKYMVVFSDGSTKIHDLTATVQNADSDTHDTIDSDGAPDYYAETWLNGTTITGIELPDVSQIQRTNYISSYHDQGLFYANRAVEGLAWWDDDRNGAQNEDESCRISGVTVQLLQKDAEGNYQTFATILTGQKWDGKTGSVSNHETGCYLFENLPAGEYAVRFTSGVGLDLAKVEATLANQGNNDTLDSDGIPTYTDSKLTRTDITGIDLTITAQQMLAQGVGRVVSSNHDSGFFKETAFSLKKINADGNLLTGAYFGITDANGNTIYFNRLEDGSYYAVQSSNLTAPALELNKSYYLVNAAYPAMAVGASGAYSGSNSSGANGRLIRLSRCSFSENQQFTVTAGANGTYRLTNKQLGAYVDYNSGINVHCWVNGSYIDWNVSANSDGTFSLIGSGKYLTATGTVIADGLQVDLGTREAVPAANQRWFFIPVENAEGTIIQMLDSTTASRPIQISAAMEGSVKLLSRLDASFALGANGENKAAISTSTQNHLLQWMQDGTFALKLDNGRNLDLDTNTGSTVHYFTAADPVSDAQHWYFERLTDTTYLLRNKNLTEKVLDVSGATVAEGKTVIGHQQHNGENQQWYLTASNGSLSLRLDRGQSTIKGLLPGTYALTEIQAPAGYSSLDGTISFSIDRDGNVSIIGATAYGKTETAEDGTPVISILNTTGRELPATGGSGTELYYTIGVGLMLAALGAAVLNRKRRKA